MEPTWKKREAGVQKIKVPNPHTKVPLIVKPLQLPRHTYTQVSLLLKVNATDLIYYHHFVKMKRIWSLHRGFNIDFPFGG